MRLLIALVLVLFLSSCQQRYRHVKRVKADKNHSLQKEETKPDKQVQTEEIVLNDTLVELSVQAPETATEEAKTKAETPDTKARTFVEKLKETQKLFPSGIFKDLSPDRSESLPDDEPLSTGEKLLILSIFYVWFFSFVSIALIPAGIVVMLLFFSGLFGIPLISPSTIVILLVTAGILLLLCFIFSFHIGKKRINKKLGRDLKWVDLIGYFLFAVLLFFIASSLFALFMNMLAIALILQYLPYLLLIIAIIYIMVWR